jgi:hypothetical protein
MTEPPHAANLAELKRKLQDHFSDALVTVVGSGHSAALGIPNMRALAEELEREMPGRAGAALSEWQSVASQLAGGAGLETALDELAVLQAMIDGIRVDARDHIEPTFRVPAVRIDYGYMEPADLKSNRSARLPGGRMSLVDAV